MKDKIHTVIFDLDGTLSDSGILTMAAFKIILPRHGIEIPSIDAIRRTTGYANPEFYYILFPDIPKEKVRIVAEEVEKKESLDLSSYSEELLFPGVRELLHKLKEKNICLKIASTGDTDHVFPIVKVTGIEDLFEKISCHRPDKTEMLRELTTEGEKSGYVMVGDMKKDYEAARANGITSIGACFGYCVKEQSNFDYYVDHPLDILKILNI